MGKICEGIYEHGVIKPLEQLDLPEHQRVRITVEPVTEVTPHDILEAAAAVYQDLSTQEIADVEAIALSRNHFFRTRR